MRTIGYYDDSAGPSGTTQYLLELLSGLDQSRYRPLVFSPRPASWHDACRELGAQVITANDQILPASLPTPVPAAAEEPRPTPSRAARILRTVGLHRGFMREARSLAAMFRQHRVDILHSNNAGEEPAPVAAKLAEIPLVIGTLHVDPTYDLFGERSGSTHRALQLKSFAAMNLAISVSRRTEEEWRKHLQLDGDKGPRFVVVHNGIRLARLTRRRSVTEAKALLGISDATLVIGSTGRLDWAKGYGDLIAAMPAILAAFPQAMLVHAGRGPLAQRLEKQAAQLGISDRVRWLGFRADVRDLLEGCDLYIQPSWCEAHTLSVLEAGAFDLPVVATDVGGHAETLMNEAGWIVPARDSSALAATAIAAIRTPGDRGSNLGARVRSYYTSERMVRDTVEMYDNS